MTQHTPGPWHIVEKEAHKGQGILHIVEESGDPYLEIATLMAHKEELEANARLIAAAPELLEQLERSTRALEWWKSHHVLQWDSTDEEQLQRNKAVIAKAKGEA